MAEFHAKPREGSERVDDKTTTITGVVISVVGIGPGLDGVCRLQSAQIGCKTRSSFPQVKASPRFDPGSESQNAHPERVCCITMSPRWHHSRPSTYDGRR
jgi:hypothetical protein